MIRKRKDGYHDLETVFYPLALHDALEVVQHASPSANIEFSTSGLNIDGNLNDNICVKAYHLLKKDFPELPAIKMHLHKAIPMGAGLGGGSADGAFTLMLLNKKFNLGLQEEKLINYALVLGSDCPFFIKNSPCIATGRGETLESIQLDLSLYKLVIIYPNTHINTAWAFSQITPCANSPSIEKTIGQPVDEWKNSLKNDFEDAVFSQYPEIKDCKEVLYKKGALYASMTGSGSTVYGIFSKGAALSFTFPDHYFVKII